MGSSRKLAWLVLVSTWGCLLADPAATFEITKIGSALNALKHSATGLALLQKAQSQWNVQGKAPELADLERFFRWGPASRTDVVLTRHYDPASGVEQRDREVTIYVRRNQSFQNIVLDIAHELVHATGRPSWDPYDPTLTPGKYIWTAIEGEGGEVEALIAECQVESDLRSAVFGGGSGNTPSRCQRYRSSHGVRFEREKVRQDFYRVGEWGEELLERLGEERSRFPLLSSEPPKLYSSTGHAPYPIALLREFDEITQVACENSRRRAGILAQEDRKPAFDPESVEGRAASFLSRRCK